MVTNISNQPHRSYGYNHEIARILQVSQVKFDNTSRFQRITISLSFDLEALIQRTGVCIRYSSTYTLMDFKNKDLP